MTHLFLTGPLQIGKTTAINRALQLLPPFRLGGFRTVTVPTEIPRALGELYLLPAQAPLLLDRYHLLAIRWGNGRANLFPATFEQSGVEILASTPADAALLLMDELGVMENAAPAFCRAVLTRLDGDIPILGVVKAKPGPLLDAVRAHPRVCLLEVDRTNRDRLPEQIARRLREQGVGR